MKPSFLFPCRREIVLGGLILAASLCCGLAARAQDTEKKTDDAATTSKDDAGDKAWREVRKATQEPMPPEDWKNTPPTREQLSKFYTEALHKGADAAKDFYTRFPTHPKAEDAHKMEYRLLNIAAARFGDSSQTDRLAALEKGRLDDPAVSDDEKFQMRFMAVQRLLSGLPGTMPEIEKGVAALKKDFPKRKEVYQLLAMVLTESEGDSARSLAKEIMDSPDAPDQIKDEAKGIMKRLDAVGKPLDIQFTAFDGRSVDLSKMKGKVVLVDFWATWCGPCMGELPHVKEAYDKLHGKGFEIVGISFDQDKDALEKTLKEKEMTWAQFFDGAGWKNKFGQQFGINSIPAMWLVDKKGNLRDVNARGELEEKVTKLLAEQ